MPSSSNRRWMTREGYDKLAKKLYQMQHEELLRIEQSLAEARAQGDISENAEFDIARSEMWRIEEQIKELERQMASAEIVEPKDLAGKGVFIGATVKLLNLETRQEEEIVLVDSIDAGRTPNAASVDSPFGQALMGKQVEELVEIDVPRGRLRYRITTILYSS